MTTKRRGFPLVLFGLGVVVLATSFFVGLSSWGKPSHRIDMAKMDVKSIQSVAGRYRLAHDGKDGKCTTPVELRSDVRNLPLIDPWGVPYVVACDGPNTKALSVGPDKKAGTVDDISAPQ